MLVTPHEGVGFPRFVLVRDFRPQARSLALETLDLVGGGVVTSSDAAASMVAIVVLTETGGQKNFSIGVWNGREDAVGATLSW